MREATEFGPGQTAILVTAITSLIVTLATLFYNYKREGRRQTWEVERRKWEAEAAERHAKATAEAKAEREEIAKRVEEAEVSLNAKIDENTEMSRQAFDVGNNFNGKIAAQGEAFDKMLSALFHADVDREARLAAATIAAAEKVAKTTVNTAANVAAKVATANEALAEVAADTTDTRQKVTEIRDKVVGNGD